ncbi:hypothetical protein [Pseudomonas citronellolis]|nr:hypothetical protein [Pseudomonas citronellolis]MDF3933122.1 hypothetical protein [Pseudomonas citronellolis]
MLGFLRFASESVDVASRGGEATVVSGVGEGAVAKLAPQFETNFLVRAQA